MLGVLGRACLALEDDREGEHVSESGSGEALSVGGSSKKKDVTSKKKTVAGKEGRALENYFEDEEWEGGELRESRKGLGGSWSGEE